jgi:hypothetical protein
VQPKHDNEQAKLKLLNQSEKSKTGSMVGFMDYMKEITEINNVK